MDSQILRSIFGMSCPDSECPFPMSKSSIHTENMFATILNPTSSNLGPPKIPYKPEAQDMMPATSPAVRSFPYAYAIYNL